jgi:PEP-CTERM motif
MKKLTFLLAVVLAFAAALSASTVTYTDRVSFYAANPGVTIEGWDTLPNGTLITILNGITYTTNDGTALVTDLFLALSPPNTLGENVNGFFLPTDTMTFVFPSPIKVFGISFNTFDTSTTGGYTATDNIGDVIPSFYDPFPGQSTGQFVGFSSTVGFTSVTLAAPGGFSYTLDDLAYGGTVPEPGSLILLGSGVLGFAGLLRRKLSL